MTQKKFNQYKIEAQILVDKIDTFIKEIKKDNEYSFAGLIMQRLIRNCDPADLPDLLYELEYEANVKTFKVDSLAQEMRFETFLAEISENPYQLQLTN